MISQRSWRHNPDPRARWCLRTRRGQTGWRLAGGLAGALAALILTPVTTAAAVTTSGSPTAVSHAYRHGLVPMLGRPVPQVACSAKCVVYHGGIDGVGVTTGKEHVYLVFWGSQWGTQGVNSSGYATFTGDTTGMAPDLQAFFAGLGSSTDKWSGVMTQYCQGITAGTASCPSTAAHVAYPKGGALAGVWEDASAAAPSAATGHQLAVEAENAATHFGNTTNASNRDAQYVVVSPTGTDPDNYKQDGFCAWHDYSADSTLDGGGSATGPRLAFTNLPYVPDAGASCGAGFVNPGNDLDGVTIVGGHEYAETITDQFPAGGWLNSSGLEVGDLCAWKTTGGGRAQDITLSTGTFAVQGIWSNLAAKGVGACAISHSIVT